MPINVDEVAAKILEIESLRPQNSMQIREMLESIKDLLQDIKTLFCIFDQVDRLSYRQRLPWRDRFGELTTFLDRLRLMVDPHSKTQAYGAIIRQIKPLLPRKDEEEVYVRKILSIIDREPAIGSRAYIPQGFVGLINLAELESSITAFSFMATSGIGPCVGYVLFSRAARCCALSHFDDPWGATEIPPRPGTKDRARNHYNNCTRIILEKARAISGAAEAATDWRVILFPSTVRQSKNLQAMLVEAVRATGTESAISEPDPTELTRDFLIELTQLASGAELQPRKYTEVIQFAELPGDLLTLREALHLPPAGFALYHITECALTLQDINGLFTMVDNYVTPRPLGVAATIRDEEVIAESPSEGASAAAAAEITAEPAIDDAAEPQQPPEAASSSASAVTRPVLMSPQATAIGPQRRDRFVERITDDHTAEDALSDSSGVVQDKPNGEPPRKRRRPGGGASDD